MIQTIKNKKKAQKNEKKYSQLSLFEKKKILKKFLKKFDD